MVISKESFATLAICALRYSMGRQTYMPDMVRGIVKPQLPNVSDKDLNTMIEDCEFQRKIDNYGDPVIDKPGWVKWEQTLIAERRSRLPRGEKL